MAFSTAQYEAVVNKLSSGTQTIEAKIPDVISAANSTISKWYVPGVVKDAIKWLAEKTVQLAEWIWNKIVELLKGAVAPIYMYKDAWEWEDIKGTATKVAGELTPAVVGTKDWQGSTATAYTAAIQPQNAAAGQIGKVADATAISLGICATAGLAFYVALGVIVVKFIAAMVAAIIAFGTAVFSWAGAAIVVEEAGVNTGMIIAAVTTLTALLAAQASQMVALHGQAQDNTFFPGGHWPKAVIA